MQTNFPLVSIITVVLNGAELLGQTIQSVLNQSYKNIEYLIIDGGSDDGTIDVIRKHENKIKFWLSEKDQGISDAFNKGIRQAKGELVGIINCGDYYEENAVQLAVGHYQNNPKAVLHGDVRYLYRNKREIAKPKIEEIWKRMSIIHSTMFVPKKIYNQHGLFDLTYKYAMDCEFVHRLLTADVAFVYIDAVISNFRVDGVSDSRKTFFKAMKEFKRSVEYYRGKSIKTEFNFYCYLLKRLLRGTIIHGAYRNIRKKFEGKARG